MNQICRFVQREYRKQTLQELALDQWRKSLDVDPKTSLCDKERS